MRGVSIISIVFLCLASHSFGIPYKDFHINLVKSGAQIETLLRSATQAVKKFSVRANGNAATDLNGIIGSAAAALPIIQKALNNTNESMKAIEPEQKRSLIKLNLKEIEKSLKQISRSLTQLNASLREKSAVDLAKVQNIANIQDKLMSTIARFSKGHSVFREYLDISTGPLLGLSAFVALFTPIRDTIYQNKTDETIVSCKLGETLTEYYPLALHWRLKNIRSTNGKPVPDDVVYDVAYYPEKYLPSGGAAHYQYQNNSDVRCNRDACKKNFDGVCFKDELQGNTTYSGYKGEPANNCLIDYLRLVRAQVQESFDAAIRLTNSSCSKAMKGRHRQATGYGWWTFTRLSYWAHGDSNGKKCDRGISSQHEACDVYIKIFINNELSFQTNKHENQPHGSFIFNYKTSKISKTQAQIRFEMWDDDSGFLGSADDLLLNKTLTIDKLTQHNQIDIKAGFNRQIDNSIRIEGSAWKDEHYSL